MATPPRAPHNSTQNENTPTVIRIPETGETEADVAEKIEISETKLEDLCKEYQELQLYNIKISEIDEKTEDELHAKPPGKEEIASTSRESRIDLPLHQDNHPEESVAKKSGADLNPNLSQHQQSDNAKTSTCEETKTHRQQEDLHQESEQSDTISKSKTVINPNLNQSHQDKNIKSKTSEETKISAPLHHQEVQEDLTGGKLTANIQESSGSDDGKKILIGSSSNQNRPGKTIKQPVIGESMTCTRLQQKQVKKQSVADQIKASIPKNAGAVPKNTGAVPKNTGAVPKNTGAVPKNTGAVRKSTGAVPKSKILTQSSKKSKRDKGECSKLFTHIPSMQRHEWKKDTSSSKSEKDQNRPSTSAAFRRANTDTESNFSTPLGKSSSAHKTRQKLPQKASIKPLATIPETITHDYATEDSVTHQQSSSSFMTCSESLELAQNIIVPGSNSRASEPDMFRGFERTSSVEYSAGASFSSFRTHVLTEEDNNQTENEQKLTGVGISPHDSDHSGIHFIPDPSDEELSQAEETIDAIMDIVEHGDVPSGLVDRLLESGLEIELCQSVEESESSAAPEGRRVRIQVTQVSKDAVFSDFNQLRTSEIYGDDDDSDS